MSLPAACHIHSNWSYDGKWTLPELAKEFSRRRYRVLMVTEHDRGFSQTRLEQFRDACARVSNENIFVLPGIEYSDVHNRIHILTWGPIPFLGENMATGELLKLVRDTGGVAIFAHPSRRDAWKVFNEDWRANLLGVEVWNRKTDGWAPSATADSFLDQHTVPFVGMDFHTSKQMFPLAMALDISSAADELSVLECLRTRRCSPQFRGKPLDWATRAPFGASFRVAERLRRSAAKAYRFWTK